MRKKNAINEERRYKTLEILEILKNEGIDINSISPVKRHWFAGENRFEKRNRLLKEINADNIDEIIEKYNLDKNWDIGLDLRYFRSRKSVFSAPIKIKIDQLGIKQQKPIQNDKPFKNQIEETLFILEKLRDEGVDVALIPHFVTKLNGKVAYRENGKKGIPTCLKDVDVPNINIILKKYGFNEDYPIGHKMRTIGWEYNGSKHNYNLSDETRKRIEDLGFLDKAVRSAERNMELVEQLINNGLDSKYLKNINVKYLCDIPAPNIEEVLKKTNIPKYTLIETRVSRLRNSLSILDPITRKKYEEKLFSYGLRSESDEIDAHMAIKILKVLESRGVELQKLSFRKNNKQKILSDFDIDDIDDFVKKLNVDKDFPLAKGHLKILNIYNSNIQDDGLTEEEKEFIERYVKERNKYRENSGAAITMIRLLSKLKEFDIEMGAFSLTKYDEEKKQVSTKLSDLPLTEEQLNEIISEIDIPKDFSIGNAISSIRSANKGKNRIAISEEEKIQLEELGAFGPIKKMDSRTKQLEMLDYISNYIDLSKLNLYFKNENGKNEFIPLGMLDLDDEILNEIKEKYNVNESYKISQRISELRSLYRNLKLSEEQDELIESLDFISELDKLNHSQRILEENLKKIEEAKAKLQNKNNRNKGVLK